MPRTTPLLLLLLAASPAFAGNVLGKLKEVVGLGPQDAPNPLTGKPASWAVSETIGSGCSYRTPGVHRWIVTAKGSQLCLDLTDIVSSPDSNYRPQARVFELRTPGGTSAPFLAENTGTRLEGSCYASGATSPTYRIEATFSGCVENTGFLTPESPEMEVLKGSASPLDFNNGTKIDPHKWDLSKLLWSNAVTYDFTPG